MKPGVNILNFGSGGSPDSLPLPDPWDL